MKNAGRVFLILALCFFIWVGLTPHAASQTQITNELEQELRYLKAEMESLEVITASKVAQKISDAPGTVIVITKKQIKERGYVNLQDLLEDLPSVDVHKWIEEYYNMITFRGNVEQEKFIIMRDSQRVSSPTGERIPINENFPLFNVKQVEIVFGPASALYGADAFTGIINIITENAEEVDGVVISSSAGSFDHYNNYLKFGKRLTKNIDLVFGGHYHSADNADLSKYYSEFKGTDLIVSGSTYLSAANREAFTVPTKSYSAYVKLDVYDHFTLGFNQSYLNHPSGIGASRSMALLGKDQKWETLIRNYYGEYNFDEGEKISGKSTISYLTYEVLPESKYRNVFTNFGDGYKYARSNKFMLEQQLNYQFSERHNLTGGVSWENFYSLPKTADLSKPFDPNLPASSQGYFYQGTNNTLPLKIFELNYDNIAGYIQAQSQWTDAISSTVGVRFDHNSRYGNTVNPRGGVIIKPSEKTTLEAFYGEAYLAPSPYLAYSHYGTFSGTKNAKGEYVSSFFHLPNPDLEPQKTRSPEVNLTHMFTPDFTVILTGYYSWIDNMINDTFYGTSSNFISGGEILA